MGQAAANYHQVRRFWWVVPFLRMPLLAYVAPFFILPKIALALVQSRWSYLCRFVLLIPMCPTGNLVWADGFRRQVIESRADAATRPTP